MPAGDPIAAVGVAVLLVGALREGYEPRLITV